MTGLIEAHDLRLNYGDVVALDSSAFTLQPGKIYGLLGRNGSGKSSLLSVLAGFRKQTSGTVRIDGSEVFENAAAMRRLISNLRETADHIIVIEKGRIAANAPIGEIMRFEGASAVRVVAPDFAAIQPILETSGATCSPDDRGSMLVSGIPASRIGEIFAMHRVPVHTLVPL